MSKSEFTIRIECEDRFAELAIVDSRYKVRARSVGTLECLLPRGLYMARALSGETTRQEPVHVTDADVTVMFPAFGTLQSSAPVAPEQGFDIRGAIGPAPAVTPNAYSWVCLALRRPFAFGDEPADSQRFEPVSDARGYSLCTIDGRPIHDFGSAVLTRTPSNHWVAVLQLQAGWYALAIPASPDTRVLLPLYVGQRFSPSVFIELRSRREGEPRPDLDRLLVSYDEREAGIFRDRDRMRAMELARRSLTRGRNLLTPALMQLLFEQKFSDPMLGLFAAHLLLSMGKEGEQDFDTVVDSTAKVFEYPQHPDLVVLRALGRQRGWWVNRAPLPGDDEPLVGPPLLRASWNGLLKLKERALEFKSPNSQLRTVALSLLKSNAWVVWRAPLHEVGFASMSNARLTANRAALRRTINESVPANTPDSGPRPGRPSTDSLLRGLVDHVRANPQVAIAIGERLGSGWAGGTNIERAIANATLQLTQSEYDLDVPAGYAKRLAQSVGVPLPMLAEGIAGVFGFISDQEFLATSEVVPQYKISN